MNITVDVKMRGPFFRAAAVMDIRQALHGAVKEITDKGAARLDEVLRPRPAGVFLSVSEAAEGHASVGHYRRSLHQEVQSLSGRIDDSKVVYGPWLEGTGKRNQTTRFKGYASFRKTAQWLQARARKVLEAHVLKLITGWRGT